MLPTFARQSVIVLRAPTGVPRGERDWDAAVPHKVRGCSLQRSSASADHDGREEASADAVLYCPPGSDVLKGDRIEYRGQVFTVNGLPFLDESPTGALDMLVVPLRTARG